MSENEQQQQQQQQQYRKEAREFEKEARWTVAKFLPLFVGIVVILALLGFVLRSAGLIGSTAVEREVFEHSYQRSEGLKAQIATDEAIIAEIERKLLNPNISENIRYQLEAQISAARIRIKTTEGKQR